MIKKLVFAAGLLCTQLATAEVLDYQLFVPRHLVGVSEGIIENALRTVEVVQIDGFKIQPGLKGGKMDFAIEITDQPVKFGPNAGFGSQAEFRADAYSMIVEFEGRHVMVVKLVWPELFYEKVRGGQLKPRTDGFARLVAALGHEIFGNVKNFNDRLSYYTSAEYQSRKTDFRREWRVSEIKAFSGGVKFLEALLKAKGEQFQPKTTMDLLDALEREKAVLERYLKIDREKSGMMFLNQVLNNEMSPLIFKCEAIFY